MVRTKKVAVFSLSAVLGMGALASFTQAQIAAGPVAPIPGVCQTEDEWGTPVAILCDIDDNCCIVEPTDEMPIGIVDCCPNTSVCVTVTGPDGDPQIQCSEKQ